VQSPSSGTSRALRVLAVACFVVAGVTLALPFRLRQAAPDRFPHNRVVLDVPLRRPDVTPELGPSGAISPAVGLADQSPGTEMMERSPRHDLAALGPLPSLPGQFAPADTPFTHTVRRDWKPARLKLPDAQPQARRHRLTDGDTLERLAERYLGNPARASEIFAMNRDLLAAPDLLPLGRIIRIPPADE
jgi:hypothetical protein